MMVSNDELAWGLKIAPPLARAASGMLRHVYIQGMNGSVLSYDKSWSSVFQARPDLLILVLNTYMIGKLARFLTGKVHATVMYPGSPEQKISSPAIQHPFPGT